MPDSPPPPDRRPAGSALPAQAHLVDAIEGVVGGIAVRGDEWAVILHGRTVASTDSAGLAIAMLRHTAALLVRAGRPVRADASPALREQATDEAAAVGKSLEDYLAFLEAERAELARERRGAGNA